MTMLRSLCILSVFTYLFLHIGKIFTLFISFRLDQIVKTKEDSEYSRLPHYNKGLKLLKETLESKKLQHKGKLYN